MSCDSPGRFPQQSKERFIKSLLMHLNFFIVIVILGSTSNFSIRWSNTLLLQCLSRYDNKLYIGIPPLKKFIVWINKTVSFDGSTEDWVVQESMGCSLFRGYRLHIYRFLQINNRCGLVSGWNWNLSWSHTQFLAYWFWENSSLAPNLLKNHRDVGVKMSRSWYWICDWPGTLNHLDPSAGWFNSPSFLDFSRNTTYQTSGLVALD